MRLNKMRYSLLLVISCLSLTACQNSKYANLIHKSPPVNVSTQDRYIFFMHGKIIEKKGLPASSNRYGDYDYLDMLDAFASHGFNVISEVRSSGTDVHEYAYEIADQVRKLIDAGIPASNISMSGFSKGGRITMLVSSLMTQPEINYIVLAGCRLSNRYPYDLNPSGRVLSIYDSSDDTFGSCSQVFSEGQNNLVSDEIVLNTGEGHGVFYTPIDEWVIPMMTWAKK